MATTTIPWGDGSGDNIYLTYSASQGDQTVLVSSDANAGSTDRTKTITFTASHHGTTDTKTLTVVQEGVPEPYIVFADPSVEAICATKWGDGVGIKPSQAAQVTSIANAFNGNTGITSFDEFRYFTGITSMGSAFRNSSLTKITFPPGLKATNGGAAWGFLFNGCSSLEEIDFSDFIRLPVAAGSQLQWFGGCTSLAIIRYDSFESFFSCIINRYMASDIPFAASTAAAHYLFIGGVELRDVSIPSSYSAIPGGAFLKCDRITSVYIPSSVTSIGSYAFSRCSSLSSITMSANITSIEGNTFDFCTSLTSFVVPEGVTTIGGQAFRGCTSLTYLEISSTVTSIATYVFYQVGTTTDKTTFVIKATTPPNLANANSFTANRINKIYVPNGTLSAYQTASNWSNFASYMAELDANGNIPT